MDPFLAILSFAQGITVMKYNFFTPSEALRNLFSFKQENSSFEGTERKDEGGGFVQSVSGTFIFSEGPNFFIVDYALHGNDPSSLFQERETQDEEVPEIGKGS
jgi:hypothetical protein